MPRSGSSAEHVRALGFFEALLLLADEALQLLNRGQQGLVPAHEQLLGQAARGVAHDGLVLLGAQNQSHRAD